MRAWPATRRARSAAAACSRRVRALPLPSTPAAALARYSPPTHARAEPFEVSDDADSVQMLTRSSQIGEFYVMMPPQVKPTGEPSKGATLHTADLMIYDEESDKHVRITWWDALKATMAEDIKTNNNTAAVSKGHNGSMKLGSWYTEAEKIAWYSSGVKSDGKTPPENFPDWSDLDLDIRIVIARPFIEHLMHNAILAVSGRETGGTRFGPADMQLSANTQVKTIEGHYTGHFKAVVTKPQNVLVMRDVACAGYVAGANCRWFAQDENGNFSSKACNENLMSRLAFDDDVTDKYASMLAFPAHEGQFKGGQLDTCMSVTTRLLPWDVSNTSTHDSFPGGNAMFTAYNAVLNMQQIHYGEDMKAAENQDFISQGSTNNSTCFLGPSRKYDPFTKSFMSLTPGQGHFGPDAIPGDARWRRGESVSLKAARDAMTSLEIAQHAQMVYTQRS